MKRFLFLLAAIATTVALVPKTSYAHRYFDSWSARWTTPDPMLRKYPGWSPYNYALDNPVRLVDPNGDSVNIVVVRTMQSKVVTQGLVYAKSTVTGATFSGYTIEPMSNDPDPYKMKIEAGQYGAWQQYSSDKNGSYDPARLHLRGAESESGQVMPNAEIHSGNTRESTTGCIIVGEQTTDHGNEIKGGTSIPALRKIDNIIDKDRGPVNVRIYNAYPIEPIPILPPVLVQPQ